MTVIRAEFRNLLTDAVKTPALACSACLLGIRCRYDGQSKNADGQLLELLLSRPARLPEVPESIPVRLLFGSALRRPDVQMPDPQPLLEAMLARGVHPVCPELFGGLGCPRLPADFFGGDGAALLQGTASLIDRSGREVSAQFLDGAHKTMAALKDFGIALAILKEGSPSCGVRRIQCSGVKVPGSGVTSVLMANAGIRRLTEEDLFLQD